MLYIVCIYVFLTTSQATRTVILDTQSLRRQAKEKKSLVQYLYSWIHVKSAGLSPFLDTPRLFSSAFHKIQPHSVFTSHHGESAIDLSTLVASSADAEDYFRHVGMQALINEIADAASSKQAARTTKGLDALAHIIRIYDDKGLADEVAVQLNHVLASVCSGGVQKYHLFNKLSFWNKAKSNYGNELQAAAMRLISNLVQRSDRATKILCGNTSLVKHVLAAGQQSTVLRHATENHTSDILSHSEASRVAMWGFGGTPWKPRMAGHRGLRILSFDGGGTRGVLSVALLYELISKINRPNIPLHKMFDVICGTSTGGIIAIQLGIMLQNITEVQRLYHHNIDAIFGKKSNIKLVASRVNDDATYSQTFHNDFILGSV